MQDHGEQSSENRHETDEADVEAHRLDAIEPGDAEDDRSAPESPESPDE
jgi:hypothetical protein